MLYMCYYYVVHDIIIIWPFHEGVLFYFNKGMGHELFYIVSPYRIRRVGKSKCRTVQPCKCLYWNQIFHSSNIFFRMLTFWGLISRFFRPMKLRDLDVSRT